MTQLVLPAFSTGVVSPELISSSDLDKIRYALKECNNMTIDPLGGAKNRPGTEYIDDCYSTSVASRLIPFQFNTEQAYVTEFNNLKMRVLKDGGLVGAPTEVVSPYTTTDLPDLKHTQSADVLYIFHEDYMIRKVTRTSDTAWTITTMPRTDGPYLPRESGDEDVRINVKFVSGTTWRLTADTAIFGDTQVGDPIRVGFPVPGDTSAIYWSWYLVTTVTSTTIIEGTIQNDPPRPVYQQVLNPYFKDGNNFWQEITAAAGAGSLSYDFANQRAVLTDDGTNDAKMEQGVLTFANVNHRLFVNIDAMTGATPSVTIKVGTASGLGDIFTSAVLTSTGPYVYSILPTQETIYINFDTAGSTAADTVEINKVELFAIGDEPSAGTEFNTTEWRLTAWNSTHGYPKAGIIDNQKLICIGNKSQPQTAWVSQLVDYEGFAFNTPGLATDSFSFKPSTAQLNGARWIIDNKGLKVGTAGAIWNIFASSGGAITPTDVNIEVDTSVGTLDLEPLSIGDSILLTPRGFTAVAEITSSYERSGYIPRDVTILAKHLFEDRRIVRWAYAKNPDSIVWCVLDDGTLLGFTYIKEWDIWAWHKHTTPLGIGFVDIAVIPNSNDDNIDDVYFVINRAEEGETPVHYLEILSRRITSQTAAYGLSASGTPYDYRFLDSALTLDDPKTITGATKADPVVITSTAHGYSDGDLVRIQNVVGMTELNNNVYKVANKTANTYELNDEDDNTIDGTGFTTYLSGGESRKMVTTLSGFGHLEGETITVLADGAVRTGLTVSSGNVTLPVAASFAHGGIPYVSDIETIDLEIMTEQGSTQGRKKSITKADIYFKDSRGAEVSTSSRSAWFALEFDSEEFGENPPDLFTGTKEHIITSNYNKQERLKIRQTEPLPVHIKRIIPDVDYGG